MHRNIFHASDPAIRPYMAENRGFGRFWGLGILPYFISYIYAIGPVWGLLLVQGTPKGGQREPSTLQEDLRV